MDGAAREAHIVGVKSNLQLAQKAAEALGDIPPILSAPGFLEHGPDEKAVIVFVAFLCARVLEVSKEDRAAQVIQHFFRQRKTQQPGTNQSSCAWTSQALQFTCFTHKSIDNVLGKSIKESFNTVCKKPSYYLFPCVWLVCLPFYHNICFLDLDHVTACLYIHLD